jgi:predicted enzyme related to lactoylglutathione lyase
MTGAFCFAELNTSDVDGAQRFYRDLFGWTTVDVPESGGHYILFQLDGRDVAGLRRRESGPHRWVGYVFVESIDDTTARATQLGATADSPAVRMPGIGRTRIIRDPAGAEIGLWEAGGHQGARVIDVAGSMWWMELMTSDAAQARSFYTSLFGWTFVETEKYALPHPYTVLKLGEQSVAGIAQSEPDWGIAPRWQVFVGVHNWKETVTKACATGGSLGFWRDVPGVGRLGVIEDPHDGFVIIMEERRQAVPGDREPNQLPAPS